MTQNKSVVITGASSGIGEAIARVLAGKGHKLMLVARREDRLQALASELGDNVVWHKADVTNRAELQAAVAKATEMFDGVDVLVNNAGIMPLSPIATGQVDEWDRMIDVNIKGVLYGINAVMKGMLAKGSGHIINISSIAGMRVAPATAVYSGTKFAVRAISEGLRQETAGKLRVTAIMPGAYASELPMTISDKQTLEAMRARFNFKPGDPERIADAVSYAIDQPEDTSVREIVVAPTEQPM